MKATALTFAAAVLCASGSAQAGIVPSIVFGANKTATDTITDSPGIFNGTASTFADGGFGFGFRTPRASSSDWVAFENTGQFLHSEGSFSVLTRNTGLFNGGAGETIMSMDALNTNEGDWILFFERGDSSTTGQIRLRYQQDNRAFDLRSQRNAIEIGDLVDVRVDYGLSGVNLYVNGVLEAGRSETADFTQNVNSLIFGSANWTASPGSFTPSRTAQGSSLDIYSATFVPSPGGLVIALAGGLVATRRKRS